jgi:hypothetical protein
MKKTKIKINKINIENDNFIIVSNNIVYSAPIISGSVMFKIYNENNKEVDLSSIDENDIITMYSNNINSIIKIRIKNKYIFNSDSSEESFNIIF